MFLSEAGSEEKHLQDPLTANSIENTTSTELGQGEMSSAIIFLVLAVVRVTGTLRMYVVWIVKFVHSLPVLRRSQYEAQSWNKTYGST